MSQIDIKLDIWKKKLLDLGKRNGLINYKSNKDKNIDITTPDFENLYDKIVNNEDTLRFSDYHEVMKTIFTETDKSENTEINDSIKEQDLECKLEIVIIEGDLETNTEIKKQIKTLKYLRQKSRTSIKEQGINTLYLSFGFLNWYENDEPTQIIESPLLLVPISLNKSSINAQYTLSLYDDEILVNPNLIFKLENDFGVYLPEFNHYTDNIMDYFQKIEDLITNTSWSVNKKATVSILSFLKINMYKDLERNEYLLKQHPLVKAFCGNDSEYQRPNSDLLNYDHDSKNKPLDTYQVLDADASQQDAILLAKKGYSFVLQGPPGTGKSQTITNIISESLASGKKILFVSEKMAALDVVYNRLSAVGLADFCLTLHSHKANKKEVLKSLKDTLEIDKINLKDSILYELDALLQEKTLLNEYAQQLHTNCLPLNKSIYDVNGILANLNDIKNINFSINDIRSITIEDINNIEYILKEFANSIDGLTEAYNENAWKGSTILQVDHKLRNLIKSAIDSLIPIVNPIANTAIPTLNTFGYDKSITYSNIDSIIEILNHSKDVMNLPDNLKQNNMGIQKCISTATNYLKTQNNVNSLYSNLENKYNKEFFNQDATLILSPVSKSLPNIENYFKNTTLNTDDIFKDRDNITDILNKFSKHLENLKENATQISEKLDINSHNTLSDINKLIKLATEFSKDIRPSEDWFNNFSNVKRKFKTTEENIIKLNKSKNQLSNIYVAELYEYSNVFHNNKYLNYIDSENAEYSNTFKSDLDKYKSLYSKVASKYDKSIFNENIKEKLTHLDNKLDLHNSRCSEININGSIFLNNQNINSINVCHKFINNIIEMDKQIDTISTKLNLSKPNTIADIRTLLDFLNYWNEDINITKNWFEKNIIIDIKNTVSSTKTLIDEIENEKSELLLTFDKDIFNIDYTNILSRFKTEYLSLFKYIKKSYKADRKEIILHSKNISNKFKDKELISVLLKIKSINENNQLLVEKENYLKLYFGDEFSLQVNSTRNAIFTEIDNKLDIFEKINDYYTNNIPKSIQEYLLNDTPLFIDEKTAIEKHLENNIFKEYQQALDTTIDDNDNISSYSLVLKDIIENIENMQSSLDKLIPLDSISLTIDEHREYLVYSIDVQKIISSYESEAQKLIKDIEELISSLDNQEDEFYTLFGEKYSIDSANFDSLSQRIDTFEYLNNYFDGKISSTMKSILLSSSNETAVRIPLDLLIDSSNSNIINDFKNLTQMPNLSNEFLDDLINCSNDIFNNINIISESLKPSEDYIYQKVSLSKYIDDLKDLEIIQSYKADLLDNSDTLNNDFGFMFEDEHTDWKHIVDSLNWLLESFDIYKKYDLNKNFKNSLLLYNNKDILIKMYNDFIDLKTKSLQNFNSINNLFDDEYKLDDLEIPQLYDRLVRCNQNISGLEAWVDFCNARKVCHNYNLENFIEICIEKNIVPSTIPSCFKKQFYSLWLDEYMPDFPAIINFRRRKQDDLIERFRQSDTKQLLISQLRIREQLISNIPDIYNNTSPKSEIGILKSQIDKKTHHLPIRELMDSIPMLLSKLKPCFMMSPLSVSLFLQSASYEFDIVIFDEASQVCTENAIGAIMRGKQVIIAGDSKQLPPTNFFGSSFSSNNNFDNDSEDELESDDYQSVLDEALSVFDDRHLRWHYRSKHESLITFSNKKIYNNSLITFPSNIENIPNNGVEYVYVEDGIYDRGSKSDNPREAKKIAQLVFEHFKTNPKRSIGVIAFSSKQQHCIEDTIYKMRKDNPQFERFFNEDTENSFFVKNLENVQGDERDTIIFSIGYAKDINGKMYQNFGPLSKSHGYRRLNVAITRSKYNLKLVGSILPTDIIVKDTTSEGVRLLRKYIDFAINGVSVLENEIKVNQTIDIESPFEESVYNYLIKNGYSVKTQVGSSGYRIDLAVEHPTLNGVFVLGIECDGAMYHSSRTARDRDRLRQTILEDIGWRIYRIWSTDWIKDIEFEGNELIKEIKKAIVSYDNNEPKNNINTDIDIDYLSDAIESVTARNIDFMDTNDLYFDEYKIFDTKSISDNQNRLDRYQYIKLLTKNIVAYEYPIHIDMLTKRIRMEFGEKRVTTKLKDDINLSISNLSNEVILNYGFLYPPNCTDIKPRNYDSTDMKTFDYISPKEISAGITLVVSKNYSLPLDALIQETAKNFGFKRVTPKIKEFIELVIDTMLEEDLLTVTEDNKFILYIN